MNSSFTSSTHRPPEPNEAKTHASGSRTENSEPSAGSSRFIFRAAQPKDLASLAELLTNSFHSANGFMRWVQPFLQLAIYEDLRTRVRSTSPHYICLVAVDPALKASSEGVPYIVGTVEMGLRCLNPWKLASSQSPYLSNLAVRKDCRRQGVASQLLLTSAQIALDWGFQDLYLHVLENNRQARKLYFKAGYRLQHVDATWSARLLGQPRRLLLHKPLSRDAFGGDGACKV